MLVSPGEKSMRSTTKAGAQMTASQGADVTARQRICTDTSIQWNSINWPNVYALVRRLQERIAKAMQVGKTRTVRRLQWLLTHSWFAKLLAVKRVVTNKGKRTPGVDGVLWTTQEAKLQAAHDLHRRGYRPLPLRRIHIPKGNGKMRPLGIPTMHDRAMQALYRLALAPVAETQADLNSYGFREYRGTADAIEQAFNCLCRRTSGTWILEGDITACFDQISHDWLCHHVHMDRHIIQRWLSAGFIWQGGLFPTLAGTPQGGIISPTLANIALDKLEEVIKRAAAPQRAHFIRYADDFLVIAQDKHVLTDRVKPSIENFLKNRGLTLSSEKTLITHIDSGVDFLGQHLRKYHNGRQWKLIITPSRKNVQRFLDKIKELITSSYHMTRDVLVTKLNQKVRGWANYHRHICAKRTFAYVDYVIYNALIKREQRLNPKMGKQEIIRRYFENGLYGGERKTIPQQNRPQPQRLLASHIPIIRHIKINSQANPYDANDVAYFANRRNKKRQRQGEICRVGERSLMSSS
jgi:RNA-directed DNA polymerase